MTARCVVVLLTEPAWAPPGVGMRQWREALAEDVVDLLSGLAEVDVLIAATAGDLPLAEAIRWPGTAVHALPGEHPRPVAALAAAQAAGYDQALVLPADLPDLPALLVGKLFRPLTSRAVVAAPVEPHGPGLIGLASRLPVPAWLVACDPDLAQVDVAHLRDAARGAAGAGQPAGLATAPGWHRQRGPEDLAFLDPDLEGWEATRLLLAGGPVR